MIDEEIEMDDELGWDEAIDLIKTFIDYTINKKDLWGNQQQPVPPVTSEGPVTGNNPSPNGRLCFVITKNKSSSWAEDLAECRSIEERTRIFN